MRKIQVLDTTLRDGEQAPGVRFRPGEKLDIGQHLVKLGVDIIQAGFPVASRGEHEAIQLLAKNLENVYVSALARTTKEDIDGAHSALESANYRQIDLVLATSAIHLQHKLKKTPQQVIELASDAVKYAASTGARVQFYAEDSTRSEWPFLAEVFRAVIKAGGRVLVCPDTVGYGTPNEYAEMFKYLQENVDLPSDAVWGCHCHDDLGLATANTLAAIKAGVTHVELTVNGLGERAGNAALEETIMALHTRQNYYGVDVSKINTKELYRLSRLVSHLSGVVVQPNKSIVGANAFSHESGMHQDGVLKERSTYEIMRAEDVGQAQTTLVLGKHSGRHALKKHLEALGVKATDTQLIQIFSVFKEFCDTEKEVTDADLLTIYEQVKTKAALDAVAAATQGKV